MAKYRKVIKDKMSGIPKKYLSGTEGSRRRRFYIYNFLNFD